jgi:hypothetical protein
MKYHALRLVFQLRLLFEHQIIILLLSLVTQHFFVSRTLIHTLSSEMRFFLLLIHLAHLLLQIAFFYKHSFLMIIFTKRKQHVNQG